MQQKKDKRIVVRIELPLWELIQHLAAKEERSTSAVIRQIIKKHFKVK